MFLRCCWVTNVSLVKNPEAFKNMNSEHHETKPKQASGYRTQGK